MNILLNNEVVFANIENKKACQRKVYTSCLQVSYLFVPDQLQVLNIHRRIDRSSILYLGQLSVFGAIYIFVSLKIFKNFNIYINYCLNEIRVELTVAKQYTEEGNHVFAFFMKKFKPIEIAFIFSICIQVLPQKNSLLTSDIHYL